MKSASFFVARFLIFKKNPNPITEATLIIVCIRQKLLLTSEILEMKEVNSENL